MSTLDKNIPLPHYCGHLLWTASNRMIMFIIQAFQVLYIIYFLLRCSLYYNILTFNFNLDFNFIPIF